MANFGPKSAALFWIISLIVQWCNFNGLTTWDFLSTWGLVSIVEKSLKMIPDEIEELFMALLHKIWQIICNKPNGTTGLPYVRPKDDDDEGNDRGEGGELLA